MFKIIGKPIDNRFRSPDNGVTEANNEGSEMTDQQLARLEKQAEAEWRKEQAEKMAQAKKAVDFVAPAMGLINYVSVERTWKHK